MDEFEYEDESEFDESYEGFQMSDAEADADTFASCGWGTDEDYGFFGDEFSDDGGW